MHIMRKTCNVQQLFVHTIIVNVRCGGKSNSTLDGRGGEIQDDHQCSYALRFGTKECVVSNYIGYSNSFGDTSEIVRIQINTLGLKPMSTLANKISNAFKSANKHLVVYHI